MANQAGSQKLIAVGTVAVALQATLTIERRVSNNSKYRVKRGKAWVAVKVT